LGRTDIEAKAMVSINLHQGAHHGQTASLPSSGAASRLRTALNRAIPIVVMTLVLVGLVAFRFWVTFPAIRDVAGG
jgi:hypothetical protein